jgi:cell wall-associated NlpC family hydrolase
MSRRVNPIILLGLIVVLILSLGILATAQSGGGTASDAIGVGEAQMGKPFRQASDGPDAFSCAGLIRYIMRTTGVDPNASFSPEGYLGAYPSVAGDPQPGDLMIFPGHATMYEGNGMVLNANELEGRVTHTPVSVLGTPLGIVRPPYGGGGGGQPPAEKSDPIATGNPTGTVDMGATDTGTNSLGTNGLGTGGTNNMGTNGLDTGGTNGLVTGGTNDPGTGGTNNMGTNGLDTGGTNGLGTGGITDPGTGGTNNMGTNGLDTGGATNPGTINTGTPGLPPQV